MSNGASAFAKGSHPELATVFEHALLLNFTLVCQRIGSEHLDAFSPLRLGPFSLRQSEQTARLPAEVAGQVRSVVQPPVEGDGCIEIWRGFGCA